MGKQQAHRTTGSPMPWGVALLLAGVSTPVGPTAISI